MLRLLKRGCWFFLLAGATQSGSAFSLLGPFNEAHQVPALFYNQPGDIGAPKNLGEEYRYNTPVLYYAFDQSFLDYFGSNGVRAVEQAFAILTNQFNGVSKYSADLSEFPLEASRINRRAQALSLIDLKSATLNLLIEQLGLAEPDRYTWSLRNRVLPPGAACPNFNYTVIKRNFDPLTFEPSSYVNGTLYTYRIREFCEIPRDEADAFEVSVDPLADTLTAVAAGGFASYGTFYTGLTRDDVGGLRYLYRTNNYNVEAAEPTSIYFETNSAVVQLLTTSNLAVFTSQAMTNPPAALQALYPDLIILSSEIYFANVLQTNVTAYFTNSPFEPVGSFSLALATNVTTVVEPRYSHTFGNVVTNEVFSTGAVTTEQTTIGPAPFAPLDSGILFTNVTSSTELVSVVNGTFYIIPAAFCGFEIVKTQLVNVVTITNSLLTATNAVGTTNAAGVTNQTFQAFSQAILTYVTNYNFLVHPVLCTTNSTGLRQGTDKISFVRKDYDSLLGEIYSPFTNRYQMVAVTNGRPLVQQFERVVRQPDILFAADDLVVPPGTFPIGVPFTSRFISFSTNGVAGVTAGPGTILPSVTFTFNKVGPIFFNFNPGFITEGTGQLEFLWGSFDGSTNAPIVYPSGTSIMNLENMVLHPPP